MLFAYSASPGGHPKCSEGSAVDLRSFRTGGDTPTSKRFVTGHDFSRAAKKQKNVWALAPEGCSFRIGGYTYAMLSFVCVLADITGPQLRGTGGTLMWVRTSRQDRGHPSNPELAVGSSNDQTRHREHSPGDNEYPPLEAPLGCPTCEKNSR